MKSRMQKLAIAAGVAAALTGVTTTSYAIVPGTAGEALLVPLVVAGSQVVPAGFPAAGAISLETNTLIRVTVAGTVGFDDVPNIYTAPNTTPTNADAALFPSDEDLPYDPTDDATDWDAYIHWYWFDANSVHRLDRRLPVSAYSQIEIDWDSARNGLYNNAPGYMVVGTEGARTGNAATFNLYGDAWLELDYLDGYFNDQIMPPVLATIPVLALSDGEDGDAVSREDNVIYKGGIPADVSPLISGMRTNRSDGVLEDITVFDLSYDNRADISATNTGAAALHVVWLDTNTGNSAVPVNVYDMYEHQCSASIALPRELNVIWVPPASSSIFAQANAALGGALTPAWINQTAAYCYPSDERYPGFVSYQLDEYLDTGIDAPESSGAAFSIDWQFNVPQTTFGATMLMGHEEGTYK